MKNRWCFVSSCTRIITSSCFQLAFTASARLNLHCCVASYSQYIWRALHDSHEVFINRPLKPAASISTRYSSIPTYPMTHSSQGAAVWTSLNKWKRITVGMFQSRQGNLNMHSGTWKPQSWKASKDSLLCWLSDTRKGRTQIQAQTGRSDLVQQHTLKTKGKA